MVVASWKVWETLVYMSCPCLKLLLLTSLTSSLSLSPYQKDDRALPGKLLNIRFSLLPENEASKFSTEHSGPTALNRSDTVFACSKPAWVIHEGYACLLFYYTVLQQGKVTAQADLLSRDWYKESLFLSHNRPHGQIRDSRRRQFILSAKPLFYLLFQ